MKSIQQTEQLSDRELKAVLRGDEASLGSLIREDAVNVIAGSADSACLVMLDYIRFKMSV